MFSAGQNHAPRMRHLEAKHHMPSHKTVSSKTSPDTLESWKKPETSILITPPAFYVGTGELNSVPRRHANWAVFLATEHWSPFQILSFVCFPLKHGAKDPI